MIKVLYHYQDSVAMTRSLLEWIANPAAKHCTGLDLSANCSLEVTASCALVSSALAQTIKVLRFTEIYFSAEQLAELLAMPALVELRVWGGTSADWAGPEYVWPTLEYEHITVLTTNSHAKHLKILELEKHNFSEGVGTELRQALPNLKTLRVEGDSY